MWCAPARRALRAAHELQTGEDAAATTLRLQAAAVERAFAHFLERRVGADVAGLIRAYETCARCGASCTDGDGCVVPHPAHLTRDRGVTMSPLRYESLYACAACGQRFAEVVEASDKTPRAEGCTAAGV